MTFVRTLTCAGGLGAALGLLALACGDDAGAGVTGDTPGPNDRGDAGTAQDGAGEASLPADGGSPGAFTFRDRLAGWSSGYTGGWYRAHGYALRGRRLFSIPDGVAAPLGAVTLVDVSTPKARVFTVPVTGTVPTGTVESFVYDPASDRVVMVVRPPGAANPEIATIALTDTGAVFSTLTQAGPPPASKFLRGPLYATGAPGVVVVGLGDMTATLTISGTTATWSTEVSATITPGNTSAAMEDPTHGRVLSFGKLVFDPITKKQHTEPNVQVLTLAPPYTWSSLPFSGDAPPSSDGYGPTFAVYDEKSGRVIASSYHDGQCGPTPCRIPGLWSFDLAGGRWTKLKNEWPSEHVYSKPTPFIVDQEGRRVLEPTDGSLSAMSLDPTDTSFSDTELAMDGDLGPASESESTVLPDGRIVSGRARFRVLDPAATSPRWERFGSATMPAGLSAASLAADPKSGEVLVFGTVKTPTPHAELHVLSADGKRVTKVTATGEPPVREGHGALVVDGVLAIAGGSSESGARDDVWTFDRASSTWKKLASLPSPVGRAKIGVGPDGQLLVTGAADAQNAPVFAVDRSSGAVRKWDAAPPKTSLWSLAPFGGCFVGYESGNTVDSSVPTVWRCSLEGGALRWTSAPLDAPDFALHGLRGAGSADGKRAYFVGPHLWEVAAK